MQGNSRDQRQLEVYADFEKQRVNRARATKRDAHFAEKRGARFANTIMSKTRNILRSLSMGAV
jgi:hypothetical protein